MVSDTIEVLSISFLLLISAGMIVSMVSVDINQNARASLDKDIVGNELRLTIVSLDNSEYIVVKGFDEDDFSQLPTLEGVGLPVILASNLSRPTQT